MNFFMNYFLHNFSKKKLSLILTQKLEEKSVQSKFSVWKKSSLPFLIFHVEFISVTFHFGQILLNI